MDDEGRTTRRRAGVVGSRGGDCEYGADDTMSDRASHLHRCRIQGRRGVKEKKKKKVRPALSGNRLNPRGYLPIPHTPMYMILLQYYDVYSAHDTHSGALCTGRARCVVRVRRYTNIIIWYLFSGLCLFS